MSLADEPADRRGLLPRYTLKDANTVLLADALGDIQGSDDGLFTNDTRVLSRLELAIAGRRPSLLGAAINQDNTVFTAHLTNRPLAALGAVALPQGVIHIERSRFLWGSRLYERLTLTNFSEHDAEVPLTLGFAADFADIFEVQGHVRKERGVHLPALVTERAVQLSYRGRDEVVRSTDIAFSLPPASISPHDAEFRIELRRGASAQMYLEIGAEDDSVPSPERFNIAGAELSASMQGRLRQGAWISTSGRLFNQWIEKSRSDLALLTTALPTGPYPYAGIPWFATQFGRDAIITSLQMLWINPQLAAGVLSFLASTQAEETSAFRDAQPGKIMHETRRGYHAAVRDARRRLRGAHRQSRARRSNLDPSARGDRLDRAAAGRQPHGISRLRPRRAKRPGEPGLERQSRFDVPRGRALSARPARRRRGPGVRLCSARGHVGTGCDAR